MITVQQLIQKSLGRADTRTDRSIAITPEIEQLIEAGAPIAIGVSGGKDSTVLAAAIIEYIRGRDHRCPIVLVHADLGRVEWRESLPVCERLAARYGVELLVVRRDAGDMMDRWLTRWENNVARYVDLRCVKLILPWSTPSMRFCTSELKTAVICRALTKRFPGQTIISASGIRRAESSSRARAPIAAPQAKLTSKTHNTTGIDWHPIIEWTHLDVFEYVDSYCLELHEAYLRYEMSRVSCSFCIMGNEHDLIASASCDDNVAVYREMVNLEIISTFAFQGSRWLGDVAPERLTSDQVKSIEAAKEAAAIREDVEATIPKHLLFVKGWPHVMPTLDEADLLCDVRKAVGAACGLQPKYTEPAALIARYAELMENAAREARR